MATTSDLYQMIAPALAQIDNYNGKEAPDDYYQKILSVFDSIATAIMAANGATAGTFVDTHKCDILKSKMGEKFRPVPANDPYTNNNPAINSPATFIVWLQHKYREVTAGNDELALQTLIQERFNTMDTPETYEARIRKLRVGFDDATVLQILYTHIPVELRNNVKTYMAIRGDGNQNVENFFKDLKKCWLDRYGISSSQSTVSLPQKQSTYQQPVIPLTQDNRALDEIEMIAMRLGYPDDASRNLNDMRTFIDDQFERLGYHMRRQSKSAYNMKKKPAKSKKSVRHCSNCGSVKHTKRSCNSKRKSKKFNLGNRPESESESSENETSSSEEEEESDESSSEEDESRHFNAGKKKNQ